MPYPTIYHWTKASLRRIKQSKNANNASELFVQDIRNCLFNLPLSQFILRLAIRRAYSCFFTPAICSRTIHSCIFNRPMGFANPFHFGKSGFSAYFSRQIRISGFYPDFFVQVRIGPYILFSIVSHTGDVGLLMKIKMQ